MTTRSHTGSNRIYRSHDGIFAGVCAGIAEAFDFHPWGVRAMFIALQFTIFPCTFLVYIALWMMFKKRSYRVYEERYDRW
jgi:phage shock protein PspC (stress-responsive transcriptional regulator)